MVGAGQARPQAPPTLPPARGAATSFLPTRDLCSPKQIDVSCSAGIAKARQGLDCLSQVIGHAGRDRWHALPQRASQDAAQAAAEGDDSREAEDSFEQRYLRVWLTRLISELSTSNGVQDDAEQQLLDEMFDRASKLISACAGKMASGPTTRIHRFARPDLDIRVPLRDGTLVHDSLGTHTWGAAPILTQLILPLAPRPRQRLKVLELGAGTGLVGLALAQSLHADDPNLDHLVCATDYHPTVMENLAHNATINGWNHDGKRNDSSVTFQVKTLDWQAIHRSQNAGLDRLPPGAGADYVSTAQTVSATPLQDNNAPWASQLDGDSDGSFDILIAADCIYDPQHPIWIRSVAQKYLKSGRASLQRHPVLHMMLPLRSTHSRELKAVYEAFPPAQQDRRPGAATAELRILAEEDFTGYDDFGAPSLSFYSGGSASEGAGGSANKGTYRWLRIGWATGV